MKDQTPTYDDQFTDAENVVRWKTQSQLLTKKLAAKETQLRELEESLDCLLKRLSASEAKNAELEAQLAQCKK